MELPEIIRALKDPRAWPENPAEVELRQTHVSYVFLTPGFVYKVKKPVDLGFLDFTTLEKRRHYCQKEVKLNRRLSSGVYLGVVPVTSEDGSFHVDGRGEAVEYAVKMKRLPEDRMLSGLIERRTATAADMERVAGKVARFHIGEKTDEKIREFGTVEAIRTNTEENFSQTRDHVGTTISPETFELVKDYTDTFLAENGETFQKRVEGGFIKDCHGDLHTDHVFITDGIEFIDCIEFNERFRYSDAVSDAAFMAMDLDYMNRHDLSEVFTRAYFDRAKDPGGRELMDFYKCYRSYVRGKVEGMKALEPEVEKNEKSGAVLSARAHYNLCRLYATGGYRPTLVVVRGLSGTGKTTVALHLAEAARMEVVSSDAVRKELAGIPRDRHVRVGYEQDIYSRDFTRKTYSEMIGRGSNILSQGRSVILDATFTESDYLDVAKETAARLGAEFRVVECTASEAAVRERLSAKEQGKERPGKAVSDARWEIYMKQKKAFEPDPKAVRADTTGEPARTLEEVVKGVFP